MPKLLSDLLSQRCIIVNVYQTGRVQQSWVANPFSRDKRVKKGLPDYIIGRDSDGTIVEVRRVDEIATAEFEPHRRVDFFGRKPRAYLPLVGIKLPEDLVVRSPVHYVNC